MELIKFIIEDVVKDIQKKQKQRPTDNIEDVWAKCIKKNAASHTKVRFFKKTTLYINVENPAWLYELNIRKEEIVKRLQKISNNQIKDAKFRVGNIHGN